MKIGRIYFSIVIIWALYSCNHYQTVDRNNVKTNDTIDFSNGLNLHDNLKLSQIVESVNYYPIPTKDDYLIGKINKLMVTDSMFVILDKDITRAVFLHSKNGEKTYCIHKHGNGPEEYINLCDVSYNSQTSEVGIHCNIKKKILYYSVDGQYLRGENIFYTAYAAQPIGNNILLHTEFKEHPELEENGRFPNLIFLNREHPQESQYQDYYRGPVNRAIVWSSGCWISHWKDTLSIKPDHCNIVYHCTNNSIYPAHFLDFGKYNINSSYWEIAKNSQTTNKKMQQFYQTVEMYEIIRYLESERYIYFTVKQNDKNYSVIYSKRSKKKYAFEYIQDDIELYASFNPKAIFDDKLYFVLKAYHLPLMREYKKNSSVRDILDTVQENDNPVIIEVKLKDF